MNENFKKIEQVYADGTSNENEEPKGQGENFFADPNLNLNKVISDVMTPETQQSEKPESKLMTRPSDLEFKSANKANETSSQAATNPMRSDFQDMLELKSMQNQIAEKNLKNITSDETNLHDIGSGLANDRT